jgi:hypothetical protein
LTSILASAKTLPLTKQFEDVKVSSTNGKRRTEGGKRVRLSKRHLDGGVLMTRGGGPYVYDNSNGIDAFEDSQQVFSRLKEPRK